MFEDVAVFLLKKMGHSGTIPSAILPEDIPQALEQLKQALGEEQEEPADGEEGEEPKVSMSRRAYPLIKMLEASLAENCEVIWDK
jgi:hypothetical protein